MSRAWKLLCWFLLVISPAVLRGAGSASTQKADTPSGRIVDMDKFVVSAARYHWRYAKSEHFEILSSCADDNFVARIIQYAELAIKPYEKNLPTIYRSNRELPAKLIFIGTNGIERFFTSIGKIAETRKGGYPDTQYFWESYNVKWNHDVSNAEQIIITCVIPRQMSERNAVFYGTDISERYRVRSLEGEKMFSSATGDLLCLTGAWPDVSRNTITLERFRPNWEGVLIQELAKPAYGRRWVGALLNKPPLFSFRDMAENTGFSPRMPPHGCSVEDVQKFISFERQLSGFSFYCAFGSIPETRNAFVNLMKYKGKQLPVTEEIFKGYFGKNYSEFSNELDDFYRKSSKDTRYQKSAWGNPTMVIANFDPEKIPKIAWTDATRSQSACIISDWFFLNKQPDIAHKALDLAKTDGPYVLNDPEFCAALGLDEIQYGDKATALPLLEKAASAKIARPEVYRSLSRLYLENILATKGKDYKLDLAETQKVFDLLFAALKLSQNGVWGANHI